MKKIVKCLIISVCVLLFMNVDANASQTDVVINEAGQIQLIPETSTAESSLNNSKNSSSTDKIKDKKNSSTKNKTKSKFAKANKERNYVIKVNLAMNCVTVYTEENGELKPYKAMVCSSGREGHETPEGEFKTYEYYDSRLMVDNTYGRYAVRFNGQIMFHSVPYLTTAKDSLEWDQYNLLGERASLGCIRLCVGDAKWIYDNCKKGTKVIVYSDKSTPGPLGKPVIDKIPEKSPNKNWDPTDLTIENPWLVVVE